jgi:glycosyltransferase involved in cell wall biosynthesis
LSFRLLLINYEFPPLGGGGGNATFNIARAAAAQGAKVTVLTSAFRGLPRHEVMHGVEVVRIPTLRRFKDRCSVVEMAAFIASACVCAPWLAGRRKPHGVVAFFGLPCGPVAELLHLLHGIPYVVSLRGGDVPGSSPDQMAGYHRVFGPLIRHVWRRAHAVVANSYGLCSVAQTANPGFKIDVIPNGVDVDFFHPPAEGRSPTPRLLFVGRMSDQKGLDELIVALSGLPEAVELDIVGDGPHRACVEALAERLGVRGRVAFHGWLDRKAIVALYQHATLFVFPSRDEGMPNVVLEAMACGLPVVATNIAGTNELVIDGETGLLVPRDDAAALGAAISQCLGSIDAATAMGERGRRRVQEHFSWDSVAAAYLAYFRTLQ